MFTRSKTALYQNQNNGHFVERCVNKETRCLSLEDMSNICISLIGKIKFIDDISQTDLNIDDVVYKIHIEIYTNNIINIYNDNTLGSKFCVDAHVCQHAQELQNLVLCKLRQQNLCRYYKRNDITYDNLFVLTDKFDIYGLKNYVSHFLLDYNAMLIEEHKLIQYELIKKQNDQKMIQNEYIKKQNEYIIKIYELNKIINEKKE
jgi:hypothetical protein